LLKEEEETIDDVGSSGRLQQRSVGSVGILIT
jgi:hypothetical protein